MGNEVDVSWEKHVGFKYWDLNEWKSWAKQDVNDLFCASDAVIKFYEYIKSEHGGKTLADLGDIAKIYYGGIGKEDRLVEGQVAAYEYMQDVFGARLVCTNGIDGREIICTDAYLGVLDDALRKVSVEFSEDPKFIQFVREVKDLVSKILEKLGVAQGCPKSDFDPANVVSSADTARQEIPRLVNSFFEALAKFLPQASPQMFFAFSTRVLPERTANKIYPSLTSDENNGLRQRLGVELGNWMENCDEIGCKPINVYRHVDGGVLDLVYALGSRVLDVLERRTPYWSKYAPTISYSEKFRVWLGEVFKDLLKSVKDALQELARAEKPIFWEEYFPGFSLRPVFLADNEDSLKVAATICMPGNTGEYCIFAEPVSAEGFLAVVGYAMAMGYHNLPRHVLLTRHGFPDYRGWYGKVREKVKSIGCNADRIFLSKRSGEDYELYWDFLFR